MSRLWVIDTNVIVSGLIYPKSIPGRIIDAGTTGLFDFAYDSRILAEYRDVLSRPKFGFSPEAIEGFLSILLCFPPTSQGRLKGLPAESRVAWLPDPSDIPFVEVALATPDRVLVTGNRRHFSGAEKLGLEVINPAAALKILDGAPLALRVVLYKRMLPPRAYSRQPGPGRAMSASSCAKQQLLRDATPGN